MDLKKDGRKVRELEKSVLHDHIIRQEKYREELKTLSAPDIYLWDKPTTHAFVYTLYGHEMYLTYLRYSIMSLRIVCPNANIIVFVEKELHEKAVAELKHLVFEHEIHFVNGTAACYKQVVLCHTRLQRFKSITFVDADLFFLGKSGSFNDIQNDIKDMLNRNPKSYIWAFARKEHPNVSHTFMHKRGRIGSTTPDTYVWDMEEALGMDFIDIIEKDTIWNISYIFSCSPKALVTDEYKAWAMYSMYNNNLCDETIWYLWGKKRKYKNYYMTHWEKHMDISSTEWWTDKPLLLFQPMFTDTMNQYIHRKMETLMKILEIEDKYREFIYDRLQHEQV